MAGCFITFEGVDGCGKSTQARLLADRLIGEGHSVILTREPGGTPLGEKIRALLLDPHNGEMTIECEVLLYLAARAQHVHEKIRQHLSGGAIVICDRFQEATFAYQGYGRGVDMEILDTMNLFASGGLTPDLTFIFDVPIKTAFKRLESMNRPKDRLESGGEEFFGRIRQGYHTLGADAPERIVMLDGTLSPDLIAKKVFGAVAKKMDGLFHGADTKEVHE